MCLAASRKQRNRHGGGSSCHVRGENTSFPAISRSRSLETLSSGCRFPHAFLSFNVKHWQSISAPCRNRPLGRQALGNSLPQPDRHVAVGKGALSTQTHLPAPVAQGSLTAVKLCVRARVRASLCYGCGSVNLGVQRLIGVSSLLCWRFNFTG